MSAVARGSVRGCALPISMSVYQDVNGVTTTPNSANVAANCEHNSQWKELQELLASLVQDARPGDMRAQKAQQLAKELSSGTKSPTTQAATTKELAYKAEPVQVRDPENVHPNELAEPPAFAAKGGRRGLTGRGSIRRPCTCNSLRLGRLNSRGYILLMRHTPSLRSG